MASEHVFLVCGFGRCGSSLAMQMLEAGGFRVNGEWPAFEDDIVMRDIPADEWTSYIGSAVKSIDTHKFTPPAGVNYRAIVMLRDHKQQAASQVKFASAFMGLTFGRGARKKLERSYDDEMPALLRTVETLCGPKGWSTLRFEDLLSHTEMAAVQLAQNATGEGYPALDITAMVRAVKPRSSDCFPGMLEMELFRERQQ